MGMSGFELTLLNCYHNGEILKATSMCNDANIGNAQCRHQHASCAWSQTSLSKKLLDDLLKCFMLTSLIMSISTNSSAFMLGFHVGFLLSTILDGSSTGIS